MDLHYRGERVELKAIFTDADGAPVVPDTVTFTAVAPDGTESSPTSSSPEPGTYVAFVLADQSGGWSWRAEGTSATFDGAVEGTFQVQGSYVDPSLEILTRPDDLQAVRNVMGLTLWDLTDEKVRATEFGWAGEFEVKKLRSTWLEDLDDPVKGRLTRLAAVYATAALISESFAKGGTIGNTEGGDARKERDWTKFAAAMWLRFQLNTQALAALEEGGSDDIDLFMIASRRRSAPYAWHDAYPPVFDYEPASSPQTS